MRYGNKCSDSQIHTSAAILILHCERNLGRVQKHDGGDGVSGGGTAEGPSRISRMIVGDCELDGRVRLEKNVG